MKEIWSPYCKGVSLLECPSSQAEKLREEIYIRTGAGESVDAVVVDINERYGNILRMSPDFSGREGLAYWLPWIFFLIVGVGGVLWWLKKRVRKTPSTPSGPRRAVDPNLEQKILKDVHDSQS
jgi:cytochrome c-type biogenesis protein CcmH/NrfF